MGLIRIQKGLTPIMTDANGSPNNLNGRRQRRSTRRTAGSAGKSAPDQSSPQSSPVVGRRARRRRQVGRQLASTANSSDSAAKSTGSSRVSRLGSRTNGLSAKGQSNGLASSSKKSTAERESGLSSASTATKTNALKATPPSRLSTPATISKGRRGAAKRIDGNRPATAGSVPLSSSLVRRRSRKPKLPKYAISAIWILVGGLGLATIFGTILANRPGGEPNAATTESVLATDVRTDQFPITLTQEIPQLKEKLEELPALYPGMKFKAFYVDVDTGDYVDVGGQEALPAASTIKLPILLAFFEEIDKGNIDPNQTVAMQKSQVADGSGEMELSPPGTQFTALEVATQMIVNSDNTATNMMIDLLGGAEVLNQRFTSYGLEETQLSNQLPDIEGLNKTSARDLVHSMLLVQGDTLKTRSRDRVFNILKRTENKRLLAFGLEEKGALTYNKTGFIGKMLGDVALVDLSNGKRYVVSILVDRPDNDGRALELIHSVSGRTYKYTDEAIQTAVTPLGDPDGNPDGEPNGTPGSANSTATDESSAASPASESAQPSSITITRPQDNPAPEASEPEAEEDPYPSANP